MPACCVQLWPGSADAAHSAEACFTKRRRAQVVEFVRGEEYARFTRIVFDTAPTGHTLRLLTVPDFVEASLGKLIRLRKKLAAAGGAVRGLFGASEKQDEAVAKLEALKVRRGGHSRHTPGAAGAVLRRKRLVSLGLRMSSLL